MTSHGTHAVNHPEIVAVVKSHPERAGSTEILTKENTRRRKEGQDAGDCWLRDCSCAVHGIRADPITNSAAPYVRCYVVLGAHSRARFDDVSTGCLAVKVPWCRWDI